MNIAIIIPAHNEENRISETIESYLSYFNKMPSLEFSLIIVLNACSDNTKKVVEKFKSKNIILLNFKEAGKGFAVTEGFKKALKENYDLMGFVDADNSTPPEAFHDLIKNLKNNSGIITNRWHKNSRVKKQKLLRRILSRGFNFIVRVLFLFPYQDTQCGAKLFKKSAIEKIINNIYITHWAFDINLLYELRKKKLKTISIPTIWEDRGDSKLDVKRTPILMFTGAVRLRLLNSPFRELIRLYDKMPEWVKFHHK